MKTILSFFQSFIHSFGLLLFLLCNANVSNAQELKWSQPQKMSERSFITEVVGQNAEGIFVLRKSYRQPERNVTLEHYTKDMRLLHNKSYATDKGEYFVQVVLLSNEIQLYYTATDFNTREMEMRVRKLNFNLVAQGKDSVLFRMPGSDFSERKLRVYKPMGQQQSFFLFTKQSIDIPTSYHFYITDTTLHTLHAGEINLNISNKYEIENVAFTKSHIALLVREDVKRKVNKHGFMYYLAETKIGSASTILNPLFNDSINVTEGLIKADYTKNAIVFAGLFNMKDSSYAKGYYVRTHLPDSGKTITKMAVFPDGAIADLSGKNAKVKGIYNLRSGDMILRKDGGVVLTSEEYEETREAVMDMNMYGVSQTNFRYYFYYENMLVLSINPEGELDWYTVLRKEQVSVNDNGIYSSYSVSAQADKLVYIYNDLSRKSWNLSLYEVNADGESNNKIILRAQDYEAKLVPQYARQIAYDEVIIPGLSTKGYILLKVKL